jgi:hypothetical protein
VNKQTFQVKITRTYFSQQFHDDLKLLFQAAGIGENKQQVVFLFDDTQVVEETFLEDINNILSTGEVRILLNFILFSRMLWSISTLKNITISVGGELMCGNN